MSVKGKWAIVFFICVVIVSALIWNTQKEVYSTEAVVNSVWDEFEVQSTQIGGHGDSTDRNPEIFVDVYNKNEIPKVEKYLEDNLSKDDLTEYGISVFSNKGIDY